MENDGYIELKIKVATANNGTIIIVNQENGIGLYVDADGLYSEWFNFLTKKIALAKSETSESNAILPDVINLACIEPVDLNITPVISYCGKCGKHHK